ncbi:hypothetical protein D915_004180 [Fasciola hepatica]|uniref:VHS domain protein n=1 Tax=Fasciola hepatica TaxID=6192 RepID=A0A4E0RZW0_FASHE|nr:hypothetical protein D915_004180 [Fasciola hepatica]
MSVVNAFSDLLRGNPFATKIGSLIEESTEDFVGPELCQLFSQVCDAINRSPTGPKDAIRAIRRRFTTSLSSNETIAMHTLLLLEHCMLNCGYRFHVVVANREVLRDLTKCLGLTADSNALCQKVLSLIQSWARQFSSQIDLQEFVVTFQELRARGVKFPPPAPSKDVSPSSPSGGASSVRDPNNEGDNRTAAMESTRTLKPAAQSNSSGSHPSSPSMVRSAPFASVDRGQKLQADLAQVRVNICVLSDMLSELETDPNPSGEFKQLMSELAQSLFEMSKRLILAISSWEAYQDSLPSRGTTDAVLLDLLNVNDELHTVLVRYGRVVRPAAQQDSKPQDTSDENPGLTDKVESTRDRPSTQTAPNESRGCSNLAFTENPWESRPDFDAFVNGGSAGSRSAAQNTPTAPARDPGTVPLLAPGASSNKDDDHNAKDAQLIDF